MDNDDDGENFVGDGETETDENGVFKVTFTPVASPTADLAGDPSFEFTVTAHVTDDTGEERGAAESFEIGTVQWRASVWAEGAWHTPEKGVPVRVTVNSLAGAPIPVKGTLKAFRLVAPERPVRKPAGSGRYGYGKSAKKSRRIRLQATSQKNGKVKSRFPSARTASSSRRRTRTARR